MKENFYLDPNEGKLKYPADDLNFNYIYIKGFEKTLKNCKGHSVFEPALLICGNTYNLKVRYYPDEYIIKKGSEIRFIFPKAWSSPQNKDMCEKGFVEVIDSKKNKHDISFLTANNVHWCMKVNIIKDIFQEDFIECQYNNCTIQRYPQKEFINLRNSLRIWVKEKGDKDFKILHGNNTKKPVIHAAPAAYVYTVTPSAAKNKEEIDVKFSLLDAYENKAHPYEKGVFFAAKEKEPYNPLAFFNLSYNNKNSGVMKYKIPNDEHSYTRITVTDKKDLLHGRGASTVIRNDDMKVYFGDIHAKTNLSDGLGTPDDYYDHLMNTALCDFGAIADHMDTTEASYVDGPFLERMQDEQYAKIIEANEKYNVKDKFVTIHGFEMGKIKGYPGHRNVYFRGKAPSLYRDNTLEGLYEFLKGHKALIIPHHHIIWGTKPHLDNKEYSKVIEMYSMHCSSEVKGTLINNWPNHENKKEDGVSARDILDRGHKVGFIAASDNHNGAPGLSARPSRFVNLVYRAGLCAVWSKKLTREDIFDGLYNRRCYATTGARIYLDFKVNDKIMGSEIYTNKNEVEYRLTVCGTDNLSRVSIVTSDKEKLIYQGNGKEYIDLNGRIDINNSEYIWVYIKVEQRDRHMAWSSPIFINKVD